MTLFGDGYHWSASAITSTTINASTMTGNLTITGDLNGYNGILNDAPMLTSVTLAAASTSSI